MDVEYYGKINDLEKRRGMNGLKCFDIFLLLKLFRQQNNLYSKSIKQKGACRQ